MKLTKIVVICLILLLLGGTWGWQRAVYPSEDTILGRIEDLHGEVSVKSRVFWFFWRARTAYPGMVLREGQKIVTGENSWVEGEAPPGVYFPLEENSRLQLVGLTGKNNQANLAAGQVWIKLIKEIFQGVYYEIETPSAVAGVRGTCFGVKVTPDYDEFLVREGRIEVVTSQETREVRTNEKLRVEKGLVHLPESWSKDDKEHWKDLEEWEKEKQKLEDKEDKDKDKDRDKDKDKDQGQDDNQPETPGPPGQEADLDNEHARPDGSLPGQEDGDLAAHEESGEADEEIEQDISDKVEEASDKPEEDDQDEES
ncbi:MAG: FecR family protein [Halanaerobium sp.]|nr:FecR family protein [Halanaerobium sp.]